MEKILLKFAVTFCLRQVDKFGTGTDFERVKADFDVRVRALVPGEWLDDAAVGLVNDTIDLFASLCRDAAHLKQLAEAALSGDWGTTWSTFKAMVEKFFEPKTEKQVHLKSAIADL